MENFDLNSFGVQEMGNANLMEINGGQVAPSPWWSVGSIIIQATYAVLKAGAEAYIEYSVKTEGKYVIHHAI
jgi:hypothetical protein